MAYPIINLNSPDENLINKVFTKISPVPYETGIKTGYASK
jgi:hypothetical protein